MSAAAKRKLKNILSGPNKEALFRACENYFVEDPSIKNRTVSFELEVENFKKRFQILRGNAQVIAIEHIMRKSDDFIIRGFIDIQIGRSGLVTDDYYQWYFECYYNTDSKLGSMSLYLSWKEASLHGFEF